MEPSHGHQSFCSPEKGGQTWKTSKDEFEIGENVWVQNVKTKKWDKEGTITDVRIAYDGKIVSYDLKLNGADAIRHRRYLRKMVDSEDEDTVTAESDQAEREAAGQGPRRPSRQAESGQTSIERETADQGPRRSSRQAARQQL